MTEIEQKQSNRLRMIAASTILVGAQLNSETDNDFFTKILKDISEIIYFFHLWNILLSHNSPPAIYFVSIEKKSLPMFFTYAKKYYLNVTTVNIS